MSHFQKELEEKFEANFKNHVKIIVTVEVSTEILHMAYVI